jgi:hypothetical protein
MFTWSRLAAPGVLLTLALPASLAAAGLKAGVASVEITPPIGLGMYGFGNRKGGATGVLDPLLARVLVLEAGEKRLALVALDLGEPPAAEWTRRLRQNAAKTSGISYVLVAATHTHSGPDIRDECPPKEAPDWESGVLEKVGQAIDAAHHPTIRAASLGGYGAANTATYVQPDAGARIVDHAIVRVYEMLGRLRDTPEDWKK